LAAPRLRGPDAGTRPGAAGSFYFGSDKLLVISPIIFKVA